MSRLPKRLPRRLPSGLPGTLPPGTASADGAGFVRDSSRDSAGDFVVGWHAAAAVAQRSVTSVRRAVKRRELAATKGEDGAYRFARVDLEGLRQPGEEEESSDPEGRVAAQAFSEFAKGLHPREVVISLNLAPPVVRQLLEEWAEMGGDIVVPNAVRLDLERAVEGPVPDLAALVGVIDELMRARNELQRHRIAQRMPVFATNCDACDGEEGGDG